MAVPAYATDLTDIYTDTDNFSAVGGGRVTDAETDDYIQGNNCWSHDPFSSGIEGGMYDDNGAPTITAGHAVFVWTKCDVAATLATHALGGVQIIMGTATTAYDCFYVRGSDDYVYGGWQCIPVDPTKTPSTSVGSPGAYDWFGVRWNVPATGAAKGYPMKIDAMRYGKTIEITAGEVATPATWDATAIYDATTTRQWGLVQPTASGAEIQGNVFWGTAAASVYSRDSNRTITIIDTEWTDTDFTQIIFAHASNDIEWDNVGLLALGTNNRGIIDVTANGTVKWTNSVFQDIDATNLLSNSTFDGSKWLSTNAVTAAGASLINAKILTPTVALNTSALIWNVATDPDGLLDGMEFSKGTNDHHAIEFGTTSPLTMTLTGLDFSGFSGTTNAATIHVKRTSGTVTINLVGCTGTITARTEGATVVFVTDPVTATIKCINADTTANIQNAYVLVEVTSTAGGYPYLGSISVSVTTTVATVTHTGHGLSSNDKVRIRGLDQAGYNGVKTVTVTDANTYTYTVVNDGAATGTATSTFVVIAGTTDVNGEISATYSYSANQPISGKSRLNSGAGPYYRTANISATINSANGLTYVASMVPD